MILTSNDLQPISQHKTPRQRERELSPQRQMYQANIKRIKELAPDYTFDEVASILARETGIKNSGPTLKSFCREQRISFYSPQKRSRAGEKGGKALWRKLGAEGKSQKLAAWHNNDSLKN